MVIFNCTFRQPEEGKRKIFSRKKTDNEYDQQHKWTASASLVWSRAGKIWA
jgi:hypothetical protein